MKTLNKCKAYKKIGKLMFVAAFMGLATSCNDQLKEEVFNFYDVNEYFKDTENLDMAVNGVYETFSNISTYGQYWMVYDTDTDISHIQGASIGHVARDLGHYNAYATHSWLQESWQLYYRGIDRANTILERCGDVTLKGEAADTIKYKKLVAQTKCLRAMCYFDLVRLFGDVPFKLNASKDGDDFKLPKTDRNVIYDQIFKDFEEAIPDLQWRDAEERINKGAAMGLLARAYMFRGGYSLYGSGLVGEMKRSDNYKEYYQKAQTVLNELVDSNQHGLLSSYERVFRNMCEQVYDPFENICEIAFFTPTGQPLGASVMGTYNGPSIAQTSIYGRANSFIKTHHFFYDTYESGDLRRSVAIATFQISNTDAATNTTSEIPRSKSYTWAPGKWRRNWHTGAVKDNNNTDVNVVLLRYSDVLLMLAEVENELNNGPTAKAIECVNQVRRRAFGLPYKTADAVRDLKVTDFADKNAFFDYLFKERARELCFEGGRRLDLVRWNLLGKAIMDTKTKFDEAMASKLFGKYSFLAGERYTAGKHELYPIPDYDIRETKGLIIQNPGY
ncbi:RagB/SusD family nutrient uptake outer membrane protein [Bacteroides sedimenti]|uniref:Membrane protein n=1 Tax=Bacteroides sedimenti TaxID=2136147 RepID=A0ABM8IA51_9BACE